MHHDQFQTFLATKLNEAQRKAVEHARGPLLVCAGAGSGKTRVITARITHLVLNHDIPAAAIVALTFTNKAALEMRERIESFLPHGYSAPYVGTFHAYCLRLLKKNHHISSMPGFSVLDGDDQEAMVRTILKRHGLIKKITAKQVLSAVSSCKNELRDFSFVADPLLRSICTLYEQEKKLARCFDFDDLLLETLNLFKKNTQFAQHHQQTVRHILVDEYQDTNIVQHALLKAMTLDHRGTFCAESLCVVGDEDQSIYSWRGATVANIINFKHDFPETMSITIDQNYRSVDQILSVANQIIVHNQKRNHKNLWSFKSGSDRVRLVYCSSGYQEAELIALCAQELQRRGAQQSFAVLYRSHYQSRTLEEACIRHSLGYKIFGGIRFYERMEVKDILSYLRLAANPFDRISFLRAINTPQRGLGDKFQEQSITDWSTQPLFSFSDLLKSYIKEGIATGRKAESLSQFLSIFENLTPSSSALEAFEKIVRHTSYIQYLQEQFEPEEARIKKENVKELGHAIAALSERGITTINQFLDEVALLNDLATENKDSSENILLMTLHAAKGLEFDTVALVGLEEGILPSSHSTYNSDSLEEERRLLYVGITRARERLLITSARYRHLYGSMSDQLPSRFLDEMRSAPISKEECANWSVFQLQGYLRQWICEVAQPTFSNAQQKSAAPHTLEKASREHSHAASKQQHQTAIIKTYWKPGERVTHQTFGVGTVILVEERGDTPNLTINFATGRKKVAAKFVQKNS